jgi:hypothetical protein
MAQGFGGHSEGEHMKRISNIGIIGGCMIIGLSFIAAAYMFNHSEVKRQEIVEPAKIADDNGELMDITQTANYLQLSEEEIKYIMISEENTLRSTGSFLGVMFPYIKIKEEYFFNKAALQTWIMEASLTRKQYQNGAVMN